MKRLTTDTPKNNLQAALNLFYIKDHETWVRGGGPGPEYADVSLFDFIRDVVKSHIPDVELPEDNDDLSDMMPEWLMDDPGTAEGVIGLLYTAAWAYAELRHKLMLYEDTGMEPEEINRIVDAYGRGHTLRTESAERLEIVREIKTDRLRELAKAEQDGRMVMLPCGVGDTVYWLHNGVITECRVHRVQMNRTGMFICLKSKVSHGAFRVDICLGKTVFLTREEAEAALAGKESVAPDSSEEPAEPEWKGRVMRTFLGGR